MMVIYLEIILVGLDLKMRHVARKIINRKKNFTSKMSFPFSLTNRDNFKKETSIVIKQKKVSTRNDLYYLTIRKAVEDLQKDYGIQISTEIEEYVYQKNHYLHRHNIFIVLIAYSKYLHPESDSNEIYTIFPEASVEKLEMEYNIIFTKIQQIHHNDNYPYLTFFKTI
jgi:hypothetical protein